MMVIQCTHVKWGSDSEVTLILIMSAFNQSAELVRIGSKPFRRQIREALQHTNGGINQSDFVCLNCVFCFLLGEHRFCENFRKIKRDFPPAPSRIDSAVWVLQASRCQLFISQLDVQAEGIHFIITLQVKLEATLS